MNNLNNLTVIELKDFCRRLEISTSGVKADIIDRILNRLNSTAKSPILSKLKSAKVTFFGATKNHYSNPSTSSEEPSVFSTLSMPKILGMDLNRVSGRVSSCLRRTFWIVSKIRISGNWLFGWCSFDHLNLHVAIRRTHADRCSWWNGNYHIV